MCDPREQPEVCQLKVQRNEALDAQAIAMGKYKRVESAAIATAEFWRKYVEGVEEHQKAAAAAKGRVR